ncbi:helix-turn-helix domain-containing protein [Nocardiopsis salina]|uniref:helix-turn-helix domain-containing protein n=1 Tax=Nocardiopsis salina TaxID=245836 RepID=UPI00034C9859|nr:helix-turn-helix domain-containing protein [Nocardiopsis salina]
MATIGQRLSAARIAAGYTVADLSTRTRIRPKVLSGIEEEDFVPCGGDFYARGHIRSLCRVLDLDPEPLLAEFDLEHAGHGSPVFVPLPRHAAGSPATVRAAAAAREQTQEIPEDGDEPMAGPPPRRIIDDTEPEAATDRPNHFERGQTLRRPVRRNRPKKNRPNPKPAPAPESPDRAHPPAQGRHRAPEQRNKGAGAQKKEPRPPVTTTSSRGGDAVRRHWPWALVAAVVLVGGVVGVRAWQGEETNPFRAALELMRDDDSRVDSSTVTGTTEGDALVDAANGDAAEGEEAVEEEVGEVTYELTAADRTWVQVTGEGDEALYTGFLAEGEEWEHTGEGGLRIWLGNAGAVTVSVDGDDIGTPGEIGEVKEVGVDTDGFDE